MEITIIEANAAIERTVIVVFKEMLLLIDIKIMGARKVMPVRKFIMNRDKSVITRNDQKFLPEALKNSDADNFGAFFLKKLNCPPLRKIFIRKPTNISTNNPTEKKDINTFIIDPRSVNISAVKPCDSLSVIILFPKADLSAPLNGMATTETRISEKIHVIKMPFHALNEAFAPDKIEFKIFIS